MKSKQTNDRMTGWFPANVKPVRSGVYEVHTPSNSGNRYAYYDPKGWRVCTANKLEAEAEKFRLGYLDCSSMVLPGSEWRGLTKETK